MKPFAPREWYATLGWDWLWPLLGIYVLSLVPSLLIGIAPLPSAAIVSVIVWICGAAVLCASAACCVCRFREQADRLLLPGRGGVVGRAILCLGLSVVLLPAIAFWILVPGARRWMALIATVPVVVALSTALCLRLPRISTAPAISRPRYACGSASGAIDMFIGRPFIPMPYGFWARIGAGTGLILWALPPALSLMLSAQVGELMVPIYLALTGAALWIWFMAALARFNRERVGNFSELALLPGLGDPARRRRALYRATLLRPLLFALCAIGGYFIVACWQSHSAARIERSILCGVVMLLFCCGAVFQLLIAQDTAGAPVRIVNSILVPFLLSQALLQALPAHGWLSFLGLGGQWLFFVFLAMLASVPLLIIWLYTSSLARQPHPFLLQVDDAGFGGHFPKRVRIST